MYLGKIVEMGPTEEVVMSPIHPYTKALISVVPAINLSKNVKPIVLPGETPNPENVPAGCRFHPRCYCKVERCLTEEPALMEFTPKHYAACFVQEKLKLTGDRK
jgi:oligopeptide/dipeptide ABC transporter ATP-binding protein